MVVLRDEKRIAQLATVAKIVSFGGLGVLVVGLLLVFISNSPYVFILQLAALVVGFALSQVGLALSHRYLRRPRPDLVLDKAAGKFARRDGRMYHFLLPAPHVLLLASGVVVLLTKYQTGRISVEGDAWTQKGLGLRRYFGREGLGNPTREAEGLVAKMATYIKEHAPEAAEAPITPVIVFTTANLDSLDVKNSRIPATHAGKLSATLRAATAQLPPLPPAQYAALRAAFDAQATHLIEETVDADAE